MISFTLSQSEHKQMCKNYLFYFLFCFSSLAAQDSSFSVTASMKPFMLFNPDKPYVQGSISLDYKSNIHLEFGYGRRYINAFINRYNRPAHQRFKGYSLTSSIYVSVSEDKNWKLGLTYRYVLDEKNRSINYYDTLGVDPDIRDVFIIQRKIHVCAARISYDLQIDDRFSFRFLIEAGVRFKERSVYGSDFEYDPRFENYQREFMAYGPNLEQFESTFIHVQPSFFVSYKLKR